MMTAEIAFRVKGRVNFMERAKNRITITHKLLIKELGKIRIRTCKIFLETIQTCVK